MQAYKIPKTCAACGIEIPCTANETCWCMLEKRVDKNELTKLQEKYPGCLCKTCLQMETEQMYPQDQPEK